MKLRNKKTGEIAKYGISVIGNGSEIYNSLAELNEEWEDVPEKQTQTQTPEMYWYIEPDGEVMDDWRSWHIGQSDYEWEQEKEAMKRVGNYFRTKEEAEKAVEKLKAITRLKSCGFKFKGWRTVDLGADKYYFAITAESDGADKGDLDLLFSGGEE